MFEISQVLLAPLSSVYTELFALVFIEATASERQDWSLRVSRGLGKLAKTPGYIKTRLSKIRTQYDI